MDDEDKGAHVKAPSDALRKRQFTMHVICNAGEGDERYGYTALTCKGKHKGGRRTAIEKNAWNKKIPVLFQKNAWVDADIAKELAADFVQHKRKKHGDLWVVMSLDNLSAHVADDVKKTFADGHVFLLFFPPQTTESLQPIDAGYGRSIRCHIGNLLDKWLMTDENLEKWESKLTASERRVLMTHLVAEANDLALMDDRMRVGCFKRTGLLMEYIINLNLMTTSNPKALYPKLLCLIRVKSLMMT